ERADDLWRRPADGVAAHEAPDDPEQAGARESEPGQVESVRRAVRLAQAEERKRRQDESNRDVDPEDPLPGKPFHDRAADQRPDPDREAADAAPGAESETAFLARNRRREQRQR